jgi:hypothetical protein
LICGVKVRDQCGACANDGQCQNDTKYGAATICNSATGQTNSGECVGNTCTNNGHACNANGADFCCGGKCLPGNCCQDADCHNNPVYGSAFACHQNTCTRCDAVTGNAYTVDPTAGDDAMASGSGTAAGTATAGCAFHTVTKALQAIQALGATAPAGTTITILGSATAGVITNLYTTAAAGSNAPVEDLPLQVPANVKITTKTGPVKLMLASGDAGFTLLGNNATLAPVANALLTIDGSNHASDVGILFAMAGAGASASISNLTIQNTGSDGIQVTSGTANIGAGVNVSGAGIGTTADDSKRQNGLDISGGVVNISVPDQTSLPTTFQNNTSYGISLKGSAILNISGVAGAAGTGTGTVVAKGNYQGNVYFAQTPGTAITSVITGLVGWASTIGDGLTILGGSKIKVRNSVFQANRGNGVRVTSGGNTPASNSVAGIDLGSASSVGHNLLQFVVTAVPNLGAGLCIDIASNGVTQILPAAGNSFAGRDCSTTNPGALVTDQSCTSGIDLGIVAPTDTTTKLSVNADNCSQP